METCLSTHARLHAQTHRYAFTRAVAMQAAARRPRPVVAAGPLHSRNSQEEGERSLMFTYLHAHLPI
eukprot:6211339-Pleurochrysis_carterae.AAC.2